MRAFVALGIVAMLAAPALATNLIANGDFSGNNLNSWNEYHSSWSNTSKTQYDATPGYAEIYSSTNYFWADEIIYQVLTPGAGTWNFSMDISTKVGNNGWAQAFAYVAPAGRSISSIGGDIDSGSGNGFGSIEPQYGGGATVAKTLTGHVTTTATQQVVIGMKLGSYPESTNNCYFYMDNVSLTPEPASLILLALGFPMLRRRR